MRFEYYAGNFHLFSTGIDTGRYLQVFADSSARLGPSSTAIPVTDLMDNFAPDLEVDSFESGSGDTDDEELQCSVATQVGSTEDQWHIERESGKENDGVKLYVIAENGTKWYLRAHLQGARVDLVCEDYVKSIRYVRII